jgi:phosphoribosylanthranilate isomerase
MVKPGTEIWKAFRVAPGHLPDTSLLSSLSADRILLDTFVSARPGGTGECFDWNLVSRLNITLPLILAGGLAAENIKEAIEAVSPFAVDTSSGVEENGVKCEQRVKEFIRAVRS